MAAAVDTYEENRALRHNKPRSKPPGDAASPHRTLQTTFWLSRHPDPELHAPKTPLVLEFAASAVQCSKKPVKRENVIKLTHFVVVHAHRHGITTGLLVGRRGQRKPTTDEAVKLLRLHFEPQREETLGITEEKPVFIGKPNSGKKGGASNSQRLRLITKWADRLYAKTETWKGPLGTELAYLFAAIARGRHVGLSRRSALVRLLRREGASANDEIWKHIAIEE